MMFWIFFGIFSALVGAVAKRTGRNPGVWFFIAFLTSPVIGGLLLLIAWLLNGNKKPEISITNRMFDSFADALTFVRANYSTEPGEDIKLASVLLKRAANRNDCDKLAVEHIC